MKSWRAVKQLQEIPDRDQEVERRLKSLSEEENVSDFDKHYIIQKIKNKLSFY